MQKNLMLALPPRGILQVKTDSTQLYLNDKLHKGTFDCHYYNLRFPVVIQNKQN
jgi:hypothetical protein